MLILTSQRQQAIDEPQRNLHSMCSKNVQAVCRTFFLKPSQNSGKQPNTSRSLQLPFTDACHPRLAPVLLYLNQKRILLSRFIVERIQELRENPSFGMPRLVTTGNISI